MAYKMEMDARVIGGLPVTVEFVPQAAEPDVGIMSNYVEDITIVAVNGRTVKNTAWIERKMTKRDWDELYVKCAEYAANSRDDFDDYGYDD